jgi:hypothetical protein
MLNTYEIKGNEVYMRLPGGSLVIFDKEDLDLVRSFPGMWKLSSCVMQMVQLHNRRESIPLNKQICRVPQHHYIVHKNHDQRDCRKANLEIREKKERGRKSTTGYPGVMKQANGHWSVQLTSDKKTKYYGTYKTFEDACIRSAEIRRTLGRKEVPLPFGQHVAVP